MDSQQNKPLTDEDYTHKLRAEINQIRNELDKSIDMLTEKLRPSAIIDELADMWSSNSEDKRVSLQKIKDSGKHVLRVIRDNPVSSTLVASGLTLALISREEGEGQLVEKTGEKLKSAAESSLRTIRSTSTEQQASLQEKARSSLSHASSAAAGTVSRTKGQIVEKAKETAKSAQEHPATYAIGAGIAGLLLGLLTPSTAAEDRVMGEASDDLARGAKDQAARLKDKAAEMKDAVMSSDEADQLGNPLAGPER